MTGIGSTFMFFVIHPSLLGTNLKSGVTLL